MVGDLIFDQIAYFDVDSVFELLVFGHLLFNERDGFGWNVTTVVVEALELSEKREKGISDTAAKLVVIFSLFVLGVVIFEIGDLGHLSFEVGSIFEEIAFMEFIEFIPDFIATSDHFFVLFLGQLSLLFRELLDGLLFHFGCELVEDDFLFGSTILI